MDSVLRQPLRFVPNLAALSSERSCCLGRPAQRMCVNLSAEDLVMSHGWRMKFCGQRWVHAASRANGRFGETSLP